MGITSFIITDLTKKILFLPTTFRLFCHETELFKDIRSAVSYTYNNNVLLQYQCLHYLCSVHSLNEHNGSSDFIIHYEYNVHREVSIQE